jgi:hypothetical protein
MVKLLGVFAFTENIEIVIAARPEGAHRHHSRRLNPVNNSSGSR